MRVSIPEEVKQARRVNAEREHLLVQAQEEADRVVSSAQEQVGSLASDSEVMKAAYSQADEVVQQAQRSAEGIKADADQYVMDSLGSLEENLMRLLTTVRNGIRQMQDSGIYPESEQQNPEAGADPGQ
jgi:vacuolar-type H+-ATPase subunit H